MKLFAKSSGSSHVRLSKRANVVFHNQQTGNEIIRAIATKKDDISSGKAVTIKSNANKAEDDISIEIVSKHLEK